MQKKVSKIVKIPLYFFAFTVAVLFFAYITFKLLSFSRTVDVPDLSGKSLVEVNELLSLKGLNLKIEGEDYDADVTAGHIIRQDLPFGSRVKEQRSIRVFVSKGPRVQSVPSVVGESLDKAESVLVQNGLKVAKVIRVHSTSAERDRVIAQKPAPGEKITEKVTLVVSSGHYEEIYYCPDFQRMIRQEAVQLAEKLEMKINVTGEGEIVKSQKPKPGTQVKTGDTIYLILEGE
ncbi:MAG: PASTA domain-containing protein [Thermodesulfovibrionales bacterium]|nr:PASTA domain-containing protein [Thermodesulfovibrionales bacterium]